MGFAIVMSNILRSLTRKVVDKVSLDLTVAELVLTEQEYSRPFKILCCREWTNRGAP